LGHPAPILLAVVLSAAGSLGLGIVLPFTGMITTKAREAAQLEIPVTLSVPTADTNQ
jgi:hypothetical protein